MSTGKGSTSSTRREVSQDIISVDAAEKELGSKEKTSRGPAFRMGKEVESRRKTTAKHLRRLVMRMSFGMARPSQSLVAAVKCNNDIEPIGFDKLPTELIQHILETCFPSVGDTYDYQYHIIHDRQNNLKNFSQVSQRWRDICINNPQWWGFISAERQNFLLLYLERSQNAPLYIHIPDQWLFPHYSNGVLSHTLDHLPRWKAVRMTVIYRYTGKLIKAEQRGDTAPLLERLELYGATSTPGEWELPFLDPLFRIIMASTKLHHLTMRATALPSTPDDFWARLTEIKMHAIKGVTRPDILRFLSKCTNATVIEFGMSKWGTNDSQPPFSEVVYLPKLTRLTLDLYWFDVGGWMDNFNLPLLTDLCIKNTKGPHRVDRFSQFLTQSKCRLRSLYLGFPDNEGTNRNGIVRYLSQSWIRDIPHVSLFIGLDHTTWETFDTISASPNIDPEIKKRVSSCLGSCSVHGEIGWDLDGETS